MIPRELMTPSEVAEMFKVAPKTVTRWARTGRLPVAVVTLGGHRRFDRADVEALAAAQGVVASPARGVEQIGSSPGP